METEPEYGKVVDINDPGKASRIKVQLQSQDGGTYPVWVEGVHPPGWIDHPKVGDTVRVEMPKGEHAVDNPTEARYTGKVTNAANPVPSDFQQNYPKRRGYYQEGGTLLIDDDDGIVLTTGESGGNNIGVTIDKQTGSVKIFGTTSVQIDSTVAITINAPSITILGRPVTPGGGPI